MEGFLYRYLQIVLIRISSTYTYRHIPADSFFVGISKSARETRVDRQTATAEGRARQVFAALSVTCSSDRSLAADLTLLS